MIFFDTSVCWDVYDSLIGDVKMLELKSICIWLVIDVVIQDCWDSTGRRTITKSILNFQKLLYRWLTLMENFYKISALLYTPYKWYSDYVVLKSLYYSYIWIGDGQGYCNQVGYIFRPSDLLTCERKFVIYKWSSLQLLWMILLLTEGAKQLLRS